MIGSCLYSTFPPKATAFSSKRSYPKADTVTGEKVALDFAANTFAVLKYDSTDTGAYPKLP